MKRLPGAHAARPRGTGGLARRVVALCVALVAVAVSCGVPTSGDVEQLTPPFGLGDTTTSTTTTTTTTTTAPPQQSTTTVDTTSTTEPAVTTEPVQLFFVSGRQITSISYPLTSPATLAQVMAVLQAGVEKLGAAAQGLASAIPSDVDPIDVSDDGNYTATVDLPASFFANISAPNQRLAVAQIVKTLTIRPGIGLVRFTQEGTPISVPLGNGQLSEPGQGLSRSEYDVLLTSPPPTTTAPPTTAGEPG